MANMCEFSMRLRGKQSSIETLLSYMDQSNKDIWMGRGGSIEEQDIVEEGNGMATVDISGWTKWSVYDSMIENAKSMEEQRITGDGVWAWDDDMSSKKRFITLFDACKEMNINMEVTAAEPGSRYAEHYKYEDGHIMQERGNSWDEETKDGCYTHSDFDDVVFTVAMPAVA